MERDSKKVEKICLDKIDPFMLFHSDFEEMKKEKEAKLIKYRQKGCKFVKVEVKYPKRPPQIYKCTFPENGDLKWEDCTFEDITEPY
jgi:hypothetical protein